jgi:hypothetical protein
MANTFTPGDSSLQLASAKVVDAKAQQFYVTDEHPTVVNNSFRTEKKVSPYSTSTVSSSGNSILTFRLPSQNVYLGGTMQLYFSLKLTGDANEAINGSSALAWVDQFKVSSGGITIQQYNRFGHAMCLTETLRLTEAELNGYQDTAQGYTAQDHTGDQVRQYACPVSNGRDFLSLNLPLGAWQNPIEISFTLAPINRFTSADTAVTAVEITEPYLIYEELRSQAELANLAKKTDFNFVGLATYTNQISSGASSVALTIPSSHQSLIGAVVQQRTLADVTSLTKVNKFNANVANAMTKWHFNVDGSYHPSHSVSAVNAIGTWKNLQKFVKTMWGMHVPSYYNESDFTSTRNLVGFAFNSSDYKFVTSGLSTKNVGTMVFEADMTAAANTDVTTFLYYHSLAKFGNGSLKSVHT